ncbi:undecaprenyldiphospho-muramoylpentapeptide beta-N-acetylglucosaminyltransferase [Anthocerotibacter panamensis]|uniref:undecaprenyldiphospho-muramoylpentapeptide beta-N-acetylglucosaminyltransferase n=1 Tax=Anthocerotibacter panamensis TaxID=2857077 RepID=UPI001C406825|nr:undecaprenyldiphospho-muramoylpentapeptide beta-N-acetylglucosaminyltransferase [Anthocerotibacter panamensis]
MAASGTGGHIFPALAVAQELKDWDITWLGVPGRLEERLIPGHYPLVTVPMEGLQTKSPLTWLRLGVKLVRVLGEVRQLLQQGYAGVFTTGGYIAAPAILAARSLGLPVLLHESNAFPGKVTRFFSRFTQGVGLGLVEAVQYLPDVPTRWIGTPVRADCLEPSALQGLEIPPQALVLLVMGGSQGAQGINRLVRECAPAWLERDLWIVHLTGAGEFTRCQEALSHPHYWPIAFWRQMGALLYRADLVISRSGAVSLAELCATSRPSILIPYPYAADDHQAFNARALVDRGAALMFQEQTLTAPILTRTVLTLMEQTATRQRMGQIARGLVRLQAAQDMAQWVQEVMLKGKR